MKNLLIFAGCSLLVIGPAPALEFKRPNTIILDQSEIEACDGGCSLIPDRMLQEFIEQQTMRAYRAGQQECKSWVKR
ncbi:MAG: hypothetical protein WBI20_14760 [Burkholderiaceae bacterium]